ncbi:hypothetical protein BpHYR1_001050 [Brachionus plicatilis]|uniref:Uncharacterized protein n=1 Tax=Brachionus plicatilis TaxID=10195 RepID=A0A3M7QD34_BRAPC|nr:hypothetical protein BpHYR1_001050 [Brachionus plicatilis]
MPGRSQFRGEYRSIATKFVFRTNVPETKLVKILDVFIIYFDGALTRKKIADKIFLKKEQIKSGCGNK